MTNHLHTPFKTRSGPNVTTTSYAQNFEDVILLRALRHVQRGFYIDVGAQDPVGDSVSLAFYELGWRGVHVEPTPYYAKRIQEARPDEEVIEAAISAGEGSISFFEVPDTGLSTGDDAIARQHEADGFSVRKVEVPCLPLWRVLDAHRDRDIHWLKIDVEGMEDQVIESWSPASARPWIVVVESTRPNSPEPSFETWEPKLLALGYEFVYFDGLNRFYVSVVHPELKASFGPGPNYFDQFELTRLSPFCAGLNAQLSDLHRKVAVCSDENAQLRAALEEARAVAVSQQAALEEARAVAVSQQAAHEQAAAAWKAEIDALTLSMSGKDELLASYAAQIADLKIEIDSVKDHLAAVHASTSWKITAPLRSLVSTVKQSR
jgi:FkbM family methyltransferase